MRSIKILSIAPMITFKDNSWRVNKRTSPRNLNIKMRDRFPTTICPNVRSDRDITKRVLGSGRRPLLPQPPHQDVVSVPY